MPLILPGNVATALGGAYEVANSCRFNDGDSAQMQKDATSSDNIVDATISMWVKRSTLGTAQVLFAGNYKSNNLYYCSLSFTSGDALSFKNSDNGTNCEFITTRLFRDCSAWYYICVECDLSDSAADRVKIYINGTTRETSFSTSTNMSGDQFFLGKSGYEVGVGALQDASYFDGYMAEVCYIDGNAAGSPLTPTSFGEFDSDSPKIWKPKDVSGLSFGANGFYLDFEASGNLGNDANGGTDLTESNLAATDQSTDTCTNNFCVMNPLATGSNITLSEGGLVTTGNTSSDSGLSTITIPFDHAGKWYWEVKMTDATSDYPYMGIFDDWESVFDADLNGAGGAALQMDVYIRGGNTTLYKPGTDLSITAPADGNIMMFAIDKDNNKFYIGINGTWYNSGDPTTGATGTGSLMDLTANTMTMFGIHEYNGSDSSVNFGSPAYANSSSVADANGYGDFEYAPPSGYLSLCTKNLGSSGG